MRAPQSSGATKAQGLCGDLLCHGNLIPGDDYLSVRSSSLVDWDWSSERHVKALNKDCTSSSVVETPFVQQWLSLL